MKNKTAICIGIMLSFVFFAACGGGGSNAGGGFSKKMKSNEYLGNLPALSHYHQMVDSTIKADKKAEYKKLESEKSMEKAVAKLKVIDEKADAKEEENETKWAEEVAKEEKKLMGKSIPFEVRTPEYEISDLKIYQVHKNSVKVKGVLTVKKDIPTIFDVVSKQHFKIYCLLLDSNDNVLRKPYLPGFTVGNKMNEKKSALPGEQYDLDLNIAFDKDAAKWSDFAKAVFVSKEEYNTVSK